MSEEVKEILAQRGPVHGPSEVQFVIAQDLKAYMRRVAPHLDPYLREALDMIAVKMSRIMAGDQFFDDHWADISGYSECARKNLANRRSVYEAMKAHMEAQESAVQLTAQRPSRSKQ